jgi:hypothetical protein
MAHVGEVSVKIEGVGDTGAPESTVADRRRPGRAPQVPTSLLPLLRRDTLLSGGGKIGVSAGAAEGLDAKSEENLPQQDPTLESEMDAGGERLFMGVLVGALMATPFWIFAAILVWWIAS